MNRMRERVSIFREIGRNLEGEVFLWEGSWEISGHGLCLINTRVSQLTDL